MPQRNERFSPARGTAIFAATLWAIAITATIAAALGNPTAWSAVLGCSIPAALITYAAWSLHRQDQRHAQARRDGGSEASP